MGKIIRNGINYSSTVDAAKNINYDNSASGLAATTAQKAIDELNRKIAAGGGGSSSNIVYLTQDEYDALPDDKLEDGIEYWITDAGVRGSAENVSYDATASGLDAKNVQEAVDKLAEGAGNKVEYLTQEEYDALPEDKLTNNIEYRILDSGTPTTARNVGYDGTASGIDAVNVQSAIDKVSENLGVDLLWTNPNTTVAFAPQTISIDMSKYKILLMFYDVTTGLNRFNSTHIMTNCSGDHWIGNADGWRCRSRRITSTVDNKLVFSDGNISSYNDAEGGSLDNTAIIPYKIYGIK